MNIIKIFHNSDSLSVVILFILIAMSFASWYIIFWKSMKLKAEYQSYQNFFKNYLNQKNWSLKILDSYNSNNINDSITILIDEFRKLQPILTEFDYNTKKEILQMHLIQKLDEIRFNFEKGLLNNTTIYCDTKEDEKAFKNTNNLLEKLNNYMSLLLTTIEYKST